MPIGADVLSLLVCPACKGDLTYDAAAQTLTCPVCRLRYRIVNDVPDMLIDNAEKI